MVHGYKPLNYHGAQLLDGGENQEFPASEVPRSKIPLRYGMKDYRASIYTVTNATECSILHDAE